MILVRVAAIPGVFNITIFICLCVILLNVLYGKKGVAVSMSGKGCRYFENLEPNFSWPKFFESLKALINRGYRFSVSRFDQAVDDKTGLLNLDDIIHDSRNFSFVSSSRIHQPIEKFNGK